MPLGLEGSFGRKYRIGKTSPRRRGGTGSEALCTRQTLALSDRFATSAKCCDRLPASNRARVVLRLGGAIYSNDYLIPKNSLDMKMRAC